MDLNNGAVLPLLFQLPLEVYAPDGVLDEMAEPVRGALLAMGIVRVSLTSSQVLELREMQRAENCLSVGDCAAFLAARDLKASLLAGAPRLRARAASEGISVYDVRWVLSRIRDEQLLTGSEVSMTLIQVLTTTRF